MRTLAAAARAAAGTAGTAAVLPIADDTASDKEQHHRQNDQYDDGRHKMTSFFPTPTGTRSVTRILLAVVLDFHVAALLIRANQQVNQHAEDDNRRNRAQTERRFAAEQPAKLIDDHADGVSKAALPADCRPGPLGVVHLALDGADGREARSAQQVEHQEGIAADAVERLAEGLVNGQLAAAIEDAERADDVLLGDKAGDGGDSRLPVAPAERPEDPSDHAADGSEDGVVDLALIQHPERAVHGAEVGGEPDEDRGEQDDRALTIPVAIV